jgi:hypothetical protein
MDEQALLHRLSVETGVNIELLKDLLHNDEVWVLAVEAKTIPLTMKIRDLAPRVGLREAKSIAEAFVAEAK